MKKVLVTSPVQNVGKTTLSLLLIFASSEKKKKVLGIDADVGRYTLTERVGCKDALRKMEFGNIYTVDELGWNFDFGFCGFEVAVNIDKTDNYDVVIIDYDLSRSDAHRIYYMSRADLIIVPKPGWTSKKIDLWNKQFEKVGERIKKKVITYPVAYDYERKRQMGWEVLKFFYPSLYDAWKEMDDHPITETKGIFYSEEWDNYINFEEYNKRILKEYILACIERIEKDLGEIWQ